MLSKRSVLNMKKSNEGLTKNENTSQQLNASRSFRGKFRVSKRRLREIGEKGFEQMERLNHSDIGDFVE